MAWGSVFVGRHTGIAPKNGGAYREALVGQPKFINPIFSSINDVDADLVTLLYSGLFRYDTNQNLVPDIAESFTVSPDLKTFTITLRPAMRWSDSKSLTANDVIFTIETIQNPEVGSPLLPAFAGVKTTKVDEATIKFTLTEPFANFLNTLTVGIIPEHIWSEINPTNFKLAKYNLQTIGSGPWKFEKMLKNEAGAVQSYTLSPNSNYYGKKPYLGSVEFKFLDSYNEAVGLLKSQTADAVSFLPSNLKEKIGSKNFNLYKFLLPQTTAIFLNSDQKSELKELDLRRALTMAINRDQLISDVYGTDAVSSDSPLPSFEAGYQAAKKNLYDEKAANDLLDKKWKRIEPENYFRLRQAEELKNRQSEIDATIAANSSTPEVASSTIKQINSEVNQKIRAEMNSDQLFYRADGNNILEIELTLVDNADSTYDREKLEERFAKLSGGVAVIRVGAATEVEQKEKQHRIEDAISATKAAIEEGIVPGGGVALVRASKVLNDMVEKIEKTQGFDRDELTGIEIMREAIQKPLWQIAENAGIPGAVVVEEVKKLKGNHGYNAALGKYEDLVQAGIVDPKKVTRSALQNAASASAMLLTTEVVVSEIPKKEEPAPPMPHGDY